MKSGRSNALSRRHSELDSEIRAEEARPLPNSNRVKVMKREKLRIKDCLAALKQHAGHQTQSAA